MIAAIDHCPGKETVRRMAARPGRFLTQDWLFSSSDRR